MTEPKRSAEEQLDADLAELRSCVDEFRVLINDPWKPPELTIAGIPPLQAVLWNAQLAWYSLCYPRHEREGR